MMGGDKGRGMGWYLYCFDRLDVHRHSPFVCAPTLKVLCRACSKASFEFWV
jgi:hypothetical protein